MVHERLIYLHTATFKIVLAILGTLLFTQNALATHLRAGEITARRLSTTSLQYEITLTTYYDEKGGQQAANGQNDVEFCIRPLGISSGTTFTVQRKNPRVFINNGSTSVNIYRTTYIFPSPGRFVISCGIENRNENTINMANSVQTPFYVETTLDINASLGTNRTPVLLNPPLDSARTGQKFCHNPAAFDADGDSLSYRMSIPKQGRPGSCGSSLVNGYKDPALGLLATAKNELQSGAATIGINPRTGELCWDAPAVAGQYNIAFIVEEWRDGIKIGEIVRDMQIIVVDAKNNRPLIDPMKDLCVEAGQTASQSFKVTDPDGNRLIITAYGGVFNRDADGSSIQLVAPQPATLSPSGTPTPTPTTGSIRWVTNCNHIREAPYDVVVKVEDLPGANNTQLASFSTFNIKVVAPKPKTPTISSTTQNGIGAFALNWTQYGCQLAGAKVIVYRKEGCSGTTYDPCQAPVPTGTGTGYTEIANLPATATTFIDNNNNLGFKRGVPYSYRIQVVFALPQGGTSVLSDESCYDLPSQSPVMTQVTIDSTSTTKGVVTVRWSRPIGISPSALQGPFEYRLYRATGLTGTNFTQIASIKTDLSNKPDTMFIDRNLNTSANAYRYRVEFYYNFNGTPTILGDASETASSVWLSAAASANKSIRLYWQANVPWRNDNQKHRIYRESRTRAGQFNMIAEVNVQGPATFTYVDDGTDRYLADGNASIKLSADSTYCYRVETFGVYDSPRIKVGTIQNLSQRLCSVPTDSTGPCVPTLTINPINCDNIVNENCPETATNTLSWTYPTQNNSGECAAPIRYNLYFARYADDKFTQVAQIAAPANNFRHEKLDSYAGCYYITAVSRFGVESAKSNVVCNDNCATFKLPNVITPNNDGKNDALRPLSCTFFVESMQLTIVNRWGTKIFETTNPVIDWKGTTQDGKEVPTGVYYYDAVVNFKRLQKDSEGVRVKGWVQVLR